MARVPLDAVMSFIKQTRGVLTWSPRDMSDVLNVSVEESRQIITVLALQGYVKQSAEGEWMTTIAGEAISGSRPPRFSCASISEALTGLRDRIKSNNADRDAPFRITEAIAFGDFQLKRPLAQAADVGIALARNGHSQNSTTIEKDAFRRLRAGHAFLHLVPHQAWMSGRSHQRLI